MGNSDERYKHHEPGDWFSVLLGVSGRRAGLIMSIVCALGFGALSQHVGAETVVPDLTQGDVIPEDWDQDWNLGATGMRGWMYSDQLVTSDARQIAVTAVQAGSPADGSLIVGDVILGVGGLPFSSDPRVEFGKALTRAESNAGGGVLVLTRWREGAVSEVALSLPVMGDYSSTAPYTCPKSNLIAEKAAAQLAARMGQSDYRSRNDFIVRAVNGLGLLAAGDPAHLALIKAEAENIISQSREGFATWYYGYALLFVSEYVLATGDEDLMPGLERMALESARGQSSVGTWGHKFANENNRLYGYGALNAAALPLSLGLVLARKAGVNHPDLDLAIEKSAQFFRFYLHKGSVPYGDHAAWTKTHDDNGKSSVAAIFFRHLDDQPEADYFARLSLASHGPERDMGHTGVYFNIFWAIPSISLLGKRATGAWMEEYGSWYFDLARQWDGGFDYLGQPTQRRDQFASRNWDATGAYLLAFAIERGRVTLAHHDVVHGGSDPFLPTLKRSEVNDILNDGRGWTPKDRTSYYNALETAELMNRIGSWSVTVRERAAQALHSRRLSLDDSVVPELINRLQTGTIDEKLGACQAIELLGGHYASGAVSELQERLHDEDMWVRVQAAEALASLGNAGKVALPQLLSMVAQGPTAEDPRAMEQRFLTSPIFDRMLKHSLEGADIDQVRRAVIAILQNEDGRARGMVKSVFDKLSYEQIRTLLPLIYEAVATPSPSGVMFSSGIRISGILLLAEHGIEEAMELSLDMMDINDWGKKDRIDAGLEALEMYDASAKHLLPRIRQLERDLLNHPEARNLGSQIDRVQALIERLESITFGVVLRQLQDYRWMRISTPVGHAVDIMPTTDQAGNRESGGASLHSFDALSPDKSHVLEIIAAPPG